jgi:hypothetical protein
LASPLAGGIEVESPADRHVIGTDGLDANQPKLNDVLPLIENNLTIYGIAERLDISVESACALVAASLRGSQDRATDGFERFRKEENAVLVEAGLEPARGTDLWQKGTVCYGRVAALQNARRD